MRVFIAGATGAIGRPLVAQLLEAGHEVTGLTRSEERAAALKTAGAEAVVGDALDAAGVRAAVVAARPEVVMQQLTDLPTRVRKKEYARGIAATGRLRTEGTRNLIEGALAAGARRLIAQSVSFAYRPGGTQVKDEDASLWTEAGSIVGALIDMDRQVTGAPGLEGVVLRYGFFYGPGTHYASDGHFGKEARRRRLPIVGRGEGMASFIHLDDAAAATLAALVGPTGIYNVVDDEPAPAREWVPAFCRALGAPRPLRVPTFLARLAAGPFATYLLTQAPGASNARIKAELGWAPQWPDWREGFAAVLS